MSKSKKITIPKEVVEYYKEVETLLQEAGKYSQNYRLLENIGNPETNFRVKHVLESYYDNDETLLRMAVNKQKVRCKRTIERINTLCKRYDILPISYPERLTQLLLNPERRKVYKKLAAKYKKQGRIVPLQDLEAEFRRGPF